MLIELNWFEDGMKLQINFLMKFGLTRRQLWLLCSYVV